ncbi:hypothetical protein APSETT444_008469 [Aspergillus pseudonomiae]
MPLAFEDAKDDSRGDKTGTVVAALALIGNAYLLSLILIGAQYLVYALCALWAYGRGIADDTRVDESDRTMIPLTEEEMQRQQLLRLLQENQDKKRSSSKAMQKTFRVKVPEHINPGKGWDSFMPPPRENDYYS